MLGGVPDPMHREEGAYRRAIEPRARRWSLQPWLRHARWKGQKDGDGVAWQLSSFQEMLRGVSDQTHRGQGAYRRVVEQLDLGGGANVSGTRFTQQIVVGAGIYGTLAMPNGTSGSVHFTP